MHLKTFYLQADLKADSEAVSVKLQPSRERDRCADLQFGRPPSVYAHKKELDMCD